ncbi:hypothetical protein BE221DRAFT_73344 [Ostreococcus tauri]|uniref:phospholipase A2 n=1 Tax=Ostreococcus tauri TaxID=70448 RepID=A0A1Y5IC70_OSTTA|nr:hypothetical protein BE221DRAFT_73344 [Ostreococcus tauri]
MSRGDTRDHRADGASTGSLSSEDSSIRSCGAESSSSSRARLYATPIGSRHGYAWPRPGRGRRPGDVIFWHRRAQEFFDAAFTHWAVYVGRVGVWDERLGTWRWTCAGDSHEMCVECVVHLWGAPEGSEDGVNRDMDENAACVLTPLEDVGVDPRCGNAKYDAERAPLRIGEIMDRCRLAVDQGFYEGRYGGYCVRSNNCEHFATWARYGARMSLQIENVAGKAVLAVRMAASLMRGLATGTPRARDPGESQSANVAKHLIMGTRVSENDDAEIARAVRDMHDGREPVYTVAEDVAYVLDYLIDRVDVEMQERRENEQPQWMTWSSQPTPGQELLATVSFGRSRPSTQRPPNDSIDEEVLIDAADHLGGFIRQGASSVFNLLGALGAELTRSSQRPEPNLESNDDESVE